ncbi:MAG: DNA-binding protein [Firmicutes bacterium]|jgi:predicted nucleic acid-binding protein|nr:DNA-binding protein [Bacillota bacterium]
MIVISDTTPLISLMKIESLDIIEKMYKEIIIPKAVYDELIINMDYQSEIDIIRKCTFLQIKIVEENLSVSLLQKQLKLDLG